MKTCAGAPGCSDQEPEIFKPSMWWQGCTPGPTCGYTVSYSIPPAQMVDGVVVAEAGAAQPCTFSQVLEPSNNWSGARAAAIGSKYWREARRLRSLAHAAPGLPA